MTGPAGPPRFPGRPAVRVTVLFSMRDRSRHSSLMIGLLQRARRAGLAGATAFKAQEGYGASGRVHRTHLMSDDAPVTVVIVDRPELIELFLGDLAGYLDDVLVTVDHVEVVELGAVPNPR